MENRELQGKYEKDIKRLEQFRLMDDDFMTKCFEDNAECTELVLHIILEKTDLKVQEVRTQYNIKNLQGRSVRLDIFAVDSDGKRYNIEIQRENRGAAAKRARYNSSIIDANLLMPGSDPDSLPEVYVIFITENDVIGKNKALYHIDRMIKETGDLFGDDSHILYVNGSYRGETELGRLLHDFSCTEPSDMYYSILADRVRYFKEEEGVQRMSSIMDEIRNEERMEVTITVAKRMLDAGKYALEEISGISGLTLDEVMRIKNHEEITIDA